jgi:hypothetical protein
MQELKPVSWATEYAPGKYAVTDSRTKSDDDVPLVYIPDTHRIVPVELLSSIEGVLSVSEYWSHHSLGEELRAIIDKEPA